MLPTQRFGRAQAGGIISPKYRRNSPPRKSTPQLKLPQLKIPQLKLPQLRLPQFKPSPRPANLKGNSFKSKNPFQELIRGLNSTLSNLMGKNRGEDYNAVVKSFLPGDVTLLKPKYPTYSRSVQLADLDGDKDKELIASYRLNDEIKTIILKKQNKQWYKSAEISHPGYEEINFRGTADVTGEGKSHLLMGMVSKSKLPTLYGYKYESNNAKQMFTRNYQRFEILSQANANEAVPKANLAVWNKKDDETYSIDVLQWNGQQLESSKDISNYYFRKVVPYHALQLRQAPNTLSNWYNLAEALTKAGVYREALATIDSGIRLDRNSAYKDRFMALRNEITGQ